MFDPYKKRGKITGFFCDLLIFSLCWGWIGICFIVGLFDKDQWRLLINTKNLPPARN